MDATKKSIKEGKTSLLSIEFSEEIKYFLFSQKDYKFGVDSYDWISSFCS
jgi:hypothetical protein